MRTLFNYKVPVTMNDLTLEVKTIALTLMEGLSCPRSLTVAILIRYKEWVQLAQLTTDPHHYITSEDYWEACCSSDFLRKFEGLPTGINTEAAAIEKWWLAEKMCKASNDRLDSYLLPSWGGNDERINSFFERVRKEVKILIGVRPPRELNISFGPGATISDNSRHCTVVDKMSSIPTLTPLAWVHLSDWISTQWGQAQAALGHDVCEVRGNAYFTVPKDATTDRSCGKEPSFNVAHQLPVGKAMRGRMLYGGIDLVNGQFIHRAKARAGSQSGEIATIDLSSASDTVCRVLVKLALSPEWYELLCSLRSPCTTMPDGKVVYLEKFSSMGNGFTFELETVLFCAIARAVCEDDSEKALISVYGDDIIAPTARFEDIIAALRFCGFSPNKRKTFGTGCFRESCGGDYFDGVAVRPHFLKKDLHEPQDYISLANGIRRMAFDGPTASYRWPRVIRAWFCCLDNLPKSIRDCRGPKDLGDICIHDIEERWSIRTRNSIRYVRSYSPISSREVRWDGFAYCTQYAAALYLAGKGMERRTRLLNGNLSPRDSVTGYKVGWTSYS